MHEWKLADSGKEFRRALSLTPNNTSFYFAYSEYLTALHKYDGAVTELKKALKLDPLSTGILSMMSWPLYLKGDFDGCLKADKDTLQVDPNYWIPYMYDGFVFLRTKRYAEAIPQFEKALSLNPDSTLNISGLAATYALSGRRNDAMAMLAKLDDWSKQRYVSPMDIAYIYGALGDRDKAMEYFNRGYEDQSEMMLFLQLYGEFGGMDKDPRFQELRRKVPVG
jgi:tetratricopeptide (TPR) repeat protein